MRDAHYPYGDFASLYSLKLTLFRLFVLIFYVLAFCLSTLSVYGSYALLQPPMWNHSTRYFLKPHWTASLYTCDCPNKTLTSSPSTSLSSLLPNYRLECCHLQNNPSSSFFSLFCWSTSSFSLASLTVFHITFLSPLYSLFLSPCLICFCVPPSPISSLLLPEEFHLVFAAAPVAPSP